MCPGLTWQVGNLRPAEALERCRAFGCATIQVNEKGFMKLVSHAGLRLKITDNSSWFGCDRHKQDDDEDDDA